VDKNYLESLNSDFGSFIENDAFRTKLFEPNISTEIIETKFYTDPFTINLTLSNFQNTLTKARYYL